MSNEKPIVKKGRLKQTVCGWCYEQLGIGELAAAAKSMGLVGIDLLNPDQFHIVQELDLVCTMTNSHSIEVGLNDPANHDACLELINAGIEANAKAGFRNVICFSGNRNQIDDNTGIKNCVAALRKITPVAERSSIRASLDMSGKSSCRHVIR